MIIRSWLFAFLAAFQVVYCVSLVVPLRRRAAVSKRTSIDTLAAMAQNLRQKYNYPTKSLGRRQSTGIVPITDDSADASYSADLTIGTPGQHVGVILDTGSSDLWVTTCTGEDCIGAATFDPTSSSSFNNKNQQVSITYGSGDVEGTVASDTVSMGGFKVSSQTFLLATYFSSGLLDGNSSGLLGLGFRSIANTGATPFVQALASGNSLSSPLMSVYLARFGDDPNAQAEEPGGIFTLGATNSSYFQGEIDFVNIPSSVIPGFWLLPVTGVSVQGSAVSLSSNADEQLAAIDTGTTLIGGPSDAVAAIYAKIPGSRPGTDQLGGFYTYPCNTAVNLSMTFGGRKAWPISPADFQLQAQALNGAIICLGAVFDLDAGGGVGPPSSQGVTFPGWIVGDSFLKNVYTVFRYVPPSVGFAQLSSSVPGADAAPEPTNVDSGGANSSPSPSPSSSPSSSLNGVKSLALDLRTMFWLIGATAIVSVWC